MKSFTYSFHNDRLITKWLTCLLLSYNIKQIVIRQFGTFK